MKKIIIILAVIIGLMVVLIVGSIYLYPNQEQDALKQDISELPDYYKSLAKECESKGSYDCCMASVNNMAEGGYKLAENNACPEGYRINGLLCIDAYSWCEPIK